MTLLDQLFDQAIADCGQFAALLDQEQQALGEQDMAALEALLDAKTPLITTLNRHEQAIAASCLQAGKPPDERLEDYILALNDAGLAQRYDAFKLALQRCRDANERNARLIRHSQHTTSHLLDLLRNQGEASQSVYDRQGVTSRANPQRPLTKA